MENLTFQWWKSFFTDLFSALHNPLTFLLLLRLTQINPKITESYSFTLEPNILQIYIEYVLCLCNRTCVNIYEWVFCA